MVKVLGFISWLIVLGFHAYLSGKMLGLYDPGALEMFTFIASQFIIVLLAASKVSELATE